MESIIYTGPLNGLVRRLKLFSVSTLVFTAVAVPVFLYKDMTDRKKPWGWGAKVGFISGIVLSSLASSAAFHYVAGRYVLRAALQLMDNTGLARTTPINLTVLSFWGLEKTMTARLMDLKHVDRGLCTWSLHEPTGKTKSLYLALPRDPNAADARLRQVISFLNDSKE